MHSPRQHVRTFLTQTDGLTAVEYAVMLALLLMVGLVAWLTLGRDSGGTLHSVGNTIVSSTGS